jgi:hypothetical protein
VSPVIREILMQLHRIFSRAIAAALLISFGVSACEPEVFTCAEPGRGSLTAAVVNAVSGLPAGWGATLSIRAGARIATYTATDFPASDSLRIVLLSVPVDYPGLYDVTVSRVGFATWTGKFSATADRCGVKDAAQIVVRLQQLHP